MYIGTYHRLGVSIWASDLDVIRAARRRIAKPARRHVKWRAERKRFYRQMLDCHHSARRLARAFAL